MKPFLILVTLELALILGLLVPVGMARAEDGDNVLYLQPGESVIIQCVGDQILPLPLSRRELEISCWEFKPVPTATREPTATRWEPYQTHLPTRTPTPQETETRTPTGTREAEELRVIRER